MGVSRKKRSLEGAMDIGDIIRVGRAVSKVTQGELGRGTGIHANRICMYERGKSIPLVSEFCRIIKFLHLDPEAVVHDIAKIYEDSV